MSCALPATVITRFWPSRRSSNKYLTNGACAFLWPRIVIEEFSCVWVRSCYMDVTFGSSTALQLPRIFLSVRNCLAAASVANFFACSCMRVHVLPSSLLR